MFAPETKKLAFALFASLNENNPTETFSVFEVVTTREKIAESEDKRQARFDF